MRYIEAEVALFYLICKYLSWSIHKHFNVYNKSICKGKKTALTIFLSLFDIIDSVQFHFDIVLTCNECSVSLLLVVFIFDFAIAWFYGVCVLQCNRLIIFVR